MNPSAAPWQTIAEFAAARGCSIRTVKRWIESGTVESRKDGARRLVRDQKEGHRGTQERDTEGHNRDTEEGHGGTQTPLPRSEVGTQQGHKGTQKRDTAGTQRGTQTPTVETDLRAQLDRAHAEISFLRNVIEGQQRDAVELRQSLKRALDLAPKQLTAGAAPASAPEAQGAPQTAAPINHSPTPARAPQQPTGEPQRPLTYADIADQLERNLSR